MRNRGGSFNVLILRRAQKKLSDLPQAMYERVKIAICGLADDPRPRGSKKLSGRDGWRIKAGEYRVVYEIDYGAHSVTVLHVGHRRDVYR